MIEEGDSSKPVVVETSTETLKAVVVGASIEIRKLEHMYEKDHTINETGHHAERITTMISMRDKCLDEIIKREVREENDQSVQDSRD